MARETASARTWRAYKLQGRQLRRRAHMPTRSEAAHTTRAERREWQLVMRRQERKARHRQAVAQRMATEVLAGDPR